jgi:hypothetical protein
MFNQSEIEDWIKYFEKKASGINYELLTKDFSTFAGAVEDVGWKTDPIRNKCGKPYTTMTINYDGTVVLCCRDYDKHTVIGDANKESLTAIWYGDIYREVRARFKKKDFPDFCKNC